MKQIILPGVSEKEVSTKDLIISILMRKWPLTPMKTFSLVKKRIQKRITYQAVHKALKEMLESDILTKDEEGYSINTKWIYNLKKFVEELDDEYHKKGLSAEQIINRLEKTPSITIEFETLGEGYDWWLDLDFSEFGKVFYNMCMHDVYPLIAVRKIHKKFQKMKSYILLGGNTQIDRWNMEKSKKQGNETKCNIKDANAHWFLAVIGDYIFQEIIGENIKKKIYKLFEEADNPFDFDSQKFFEILRAPYKCKVVITKDRDTAQNYRDQIMSHIKKKS